MKYCPCCGKTKRAKFFYVKRKTYTDGTEIIKLDSFCIPCTKEKAKIYYKNRTPEKRKQYNKVMVEYQKKMCREVLPSYIKFLINHEFGLPTKVITEDLIEKKKVMLLLNRERKQMRKELKE